jgi:hypothetical protein
VAHHTSEISRILEGIVLYYSIGIRKTHQLVFCLEVIFEGSDIAQSEMGDSKELFI